jgi:transposase InsO family protein
VKKVKSQKKYSDSLKREVGRRYIREEFSYAVAAEEYGLKDKTVAKEFVKWYRMQVEKENRAGQAEEVPSRESPQRNYVIFITDAYSHKIMGFRVDDNMKTDMCVQALDLALAARTKLEQPLIHHSDREVQYYSKGYVQRLLDQPNIQISMTQNGDPLENALAERVNGIFKNTYNMDQQFDSLAQAQQTIAKMVDSYNRVRHHNTCDMMTPNEAHQGTGALKRRWKTYYKKVSVMSEELVSQTIS